MNKKKSLLSELFEYGGNYKYLTILGMILSGISAVSAVIPVIFIWLCVSEIFKVWPNISLVQNIEQYGLLALIFSIVGMAIYFISLLFTHFAAFRIAKNIRCKVLNHLMNLPLGYFTQSGSGKLRRVVDECAGQTESFLAHQLPDLVGAITTPIITIVILFTFNWKLGLISIAPIVLSFLAMSKMLGPDHAVNVERYQTALGNMNNEAVEYVRGIPVVKTFGQSVFSFKKFHLAIQQYKDFSLNYSIKLRGPMGGYVVFLNSIAIFLAVGGVLLINQSTTPKVLLLDLIFYLFFTPICVTMMNKIMWTSENIIIAKDAISRINEVLEEKPLEEKKFPREPKNFDIEFENVSFSYPNKSNLALSNISLKINEGSTVAIVGPSGSGKSTAVALIARFFDVNKRRIKIGGVDIKSMSEETLMKNISFVFQNSNLFKTSILENIRESKPEATEEEVLKAIKVARCEDIIQKLPNGINTVIGTKGVYLSGGEGQRIALARAILKDAPIILLDEATAFADPENEYKIQLAFEELTKNKTVIIIAHRLSTVQNTSCIYVLADGEIAEKGTHKELISNSGLYEKMWNEYQKAVDWKIKEAGIDG